MEELPSTGVEGGENLDPSTPLAEGNENKGGGGGFKKSSCRISLLEGLGLRSGEVHDHHTQTEEGGPYMAKSRR